MYRQGGGHAQAGATLTRHAGAHTRPRTPASHLHADEPREVVARARRPRARPRKHSTHPLERARAVAGLGRPRPPLVPPAHGGAGGCERVVGWSIGGWLVGGKGCGRANAAPPRKRRAPPRGPPPPPPPRTHPPTPPLSPLCHQAFKPPQRVEQVLHRVEAHDQRVVCERCQAPLLLCACMGVWAWW